MKQTKLLKEFLMGGIIGGIVALVLIQFGDVVYENFNYIHIFYFLVFLIPSALISIFVHELGHLLFGLLSGYKFSSFRFLNIHLQKNENNKLSFHLKSIPGTLGQCLMKPDFTKKPNLFWYSVGGVLLNVIAAFFAYLSLYKLNTSLYTIFVIAFIFVNILFAQANWFRFDGVLNDGYNYAVVKNNEVSQKMFNYLLDLEDHLAQGKLLSAYDFKEIESFTFDYTNPIHLNVSSFLSSYYLVTKEYEKTREFVKYRYNETINLPVSPIKHLINLDYYFMELLFNEDALNLKTNEIKNSVNLFANTESGKFVKFLEDYRKQSLTEEDYAKFKEESSRSYKTGLIKEYIDVLDELIEL